jgi:hypothetical protein
MRREGENRGRGSEADVGQGGARGSKSEDEEMRR